MSNLAIGIIAIYFNWSAYDLMVAFWLENAVIGFYSIFKMAMASGETEEDQYKLVRGKKVKVEPIKTPIIIFIIAIFFILWAIHGSLIFSYFHPSLSSGDSPFDTFRVMMQNNPETWFVLGLLFLSHTFSFFINFIGRKEYTKTTFTDELYQPFNKILIIHLIIWGMCWAFSHIHDNKGILLLIVFVKTGIELWRHLRRHDNN